MLKTMIPLAGRLPACRRLPLVALLAFAACAPRPVVPEDTLNVAVELARTEAGYQPPVFRWEAPVAARLTVHRGTGANHVVLWEVTEGDRMGPDGRARRSPLTPPLTYGTVFPETAGATPRVLVPPATLQPGVFYTVTVLGYDGATSTASFSVQDTFSF